MSGILRDARSLCLQQNDVFFEISIWFAAALMLYLFIIVHIYWLIFSLWWIQCNGVLTVSLNVRPQSLHWYLWIPPSQPCFRNDMLAHLGQARPLTRDARLYISFISIAKSLCSRFLLLYLYSNINNDYEFAYSSKILH